MVQNKIRQNRRKIQKPRRINAGANEDEFAPVTLVKRLEEVGFEIDFTKVGLPQLPPDPDGRRRFVGDYN